MEFSTYKTSFDFTDSDYETEPELLKTPAVIECAENHSPGHIILGLWPHAQPEQIQYYVQGYSTLYPNSTIHLLHHNQTSSIDSVLNNLISFSTSNEKASISTTLQTPTLVLIHLFASTSPAQNICTLLHAYQLRTHHSLPISLLILDAVPITITPTFASMCRNPALLFNFLLAPCLHIWATLILWFSEPLSDDVRRDLEALCGEARWKWIFPGRDVMFVRNAGDWEDEESRELAVGERCQRRERSVKWSAGQERYWAGVESAWEGR
ncbi:hypothetical protein AC578_6158 [Pseudocercospora eumusae]|uniref:Uncharacterized protein n=1 Tax=Pseudocercospora eumusae TaxID=321146 RepID=A0A139H9F3_9PEZI|nr:hypothetical protein AC578_6158 [Pseudocercospora eumusae]